MEVVVDAYDEYEQAMGWYYYVADGLEFPFQAQCMAKKSMSPLKVNDVVTVVGVADAEDCESQIFVTIEYNEDQLAVPLAQLEIIDDKPDSKTIIEDGHYWIGRGYEF
jgi:hypothetical protein